MKVEKIRLSRSHIVWTEALFLLGMTFDYVTTLYCFTLGFAEWNPLVPHNPFAMALLVLVVVGFFAWLLESAYEREDGRVLGLVVAISVGSLVHFAAGAWNILGVLWN